MMRLRHHGNMLGMGYMAGLPGQQSFAGATPLSSSAAAVSSGSPGLNSDGVQSNNDTPPHTPPTLKNQFGQAGQPGYNGLHNGYSQMSPSPMGSSESSSASAAAMAAAAAASSKMLMFNNMNNASSFKMM